MILKILIIVWPLLVSSLAFFYKKKQNGPNPMTGGPISIPKSFWLAYTISTWFFLPILFITNSELIIPLKIILGFHLSSWWLRGPIELFMIYKYFNWTPKYGISHDLFHLLGLIGLMFFYKAELTELNSINLIVFSFLYVTVFATLAEILFAFLFLKARSVAEEEDNIYFASDDPKWIFINRVTLITVCAVMAHLVLQSIYAFLVL
jgi:hypothetical protein